VIRGCGAPGPFSRFGRVGFAALSPPYNAARDANTSYRTNGPPNVRGVLQVRQLRDVRRDAPRLIAR